MRNARRRKEILVFAAMLGAGFDILKQKEYAGLRTNGPYQYLATLNAMHSAVCTPQERSFELAKVRKVVNEIVPNTWSRWTMDQVVWYCCMFCRKAVASGWSPPTEPTMASFVQSIYDLSLSFHTSVPMPPDILVEIDRRLTLAKLQGLFK